MNRAALVFVTLLALMPLPALAVQPDEIMTDPVLEARARDLSSQLRCMVCQNQSIDDSDAQLARDIRVLVRERLAAGDSNAKIRDFLVQRYGAFILLKPPFEMGTLLLWGTPFLALILGGSAIVYATRKNRRHTDAAVPLNDHERHRLETLLADD
ncbi:cytochrome c-type biogenesis protein [Beijerinckia sp. L45]|uniref:cytochrome c-type biogenesis protein n=1 Tax=Beijerinckia sp. L45 TaxID=1641855 RepID=UPI00131AA35A|nr:cytochrome c-type biogenesis protein [Beijerinckia sp. L45]